MPRLPEAVLTRLRASNFRSIESIDLKLGRLNVLVGQNGVGKSNIIDVLRFVRDALSRSLDQALLDRGGLGAIRRYGAAPGASDLAIQLICTAGRFEVYYGFSLTADRPTEYAVAEERLRVVEKESGTTPIDLHLERGQWTGSPLPMRTRSAPYSDSDLHLPKVWLHHTPTLEHDLFVAMISVIDLLSEMSFYNISPESLRPPQQTVAESPFDERGRNLAAVLRALQQKNGSELRDIEGALGRLVQGLRTYEIQNVGSYLVTQLLYEFSDTPSGADDLASKRLVSDLAQESDGTLRILSILAAVYQQPSRPLVVIEEPESNIHPGALGVIADLLQEASLRSQILVTTHNPDLIEQFQTEVLRVVEKTDGVTQVGPVAHDQQEAIRRMLFSTAEIMKLEGLRREPVEV